MTLDDIYAAEVEACRLEVLCEQAEQDARRLRLEYHAAVRRVRELVRAAAEGPASSDEPGPEPVARTLFDTPDEG